MTEEEYRSAEGVNKSTLWFMQKSPAHYKYYCDHEREDTPALKLGRAIHAAVLTPTAFKHEYAILPDGIDRRTKAGKETYAAFEASSSGKEILSSDDGEQIHCIVKAIKRTREACELLNRTIREKPLFWKDEETELVCKCRVDAFSPKRGIMIDLKTTTDAETKAFTREAMKYGYHVQAAHYAAGFYSLYGHYPEWYFIAVEKSPPYAVNVLRADCSFIDYGALIRMELLQKLKECMGTGSFPGYGKNDMYLPNWEG